MSRHSTTVIILFIILSAAMLGSTIWASVQIASNDLGGSYFWIQWIAIRSKVVDGISPYSFTVSHRISATTDSLYSWSPGNSPAYTDPLFSAITTLPFSLIQDPTTARTIWLVVQFLTILLTILAGVSLMGWKPAWWFLSGMIIIILLSLRTIINWYQGSTVIWVGILVMGVLMALKGKRFELAGILLSLSMLQPQLVILWVLFVLFWSVAQRKWRVLFWFLCSLVILGILAAFLDANWLIEYLRILWNYQDHFSVASPGLAFQRWWPGLGRQMGWALSGILGLILLIEWWLARNRDFRWILWVSCLTLVVTPLIGIPIEPEAHYLMMLPLLLVGAIFDERWSRGGKWVVITGFVLLSFWEWYLFYSTLGNTQSVERQVLMFPAPVLLLISLYWVRWWAIRPKRLLMDELRASAAY